ncbi:hypothetical protein [Kitasatospora azatica]|nr:hypothetical protein [Kitasatospora azatica]
MAEVLFQSPRTVEHYVANVLRKLDTTRRDIGAKLSRDKAAD